MTALADRIKTAVTSGVLLSVTETRQELYESWATVVIAPGIDRELVLEMLEEWRHDFAPASSLIHWTVE